MMRLESPAAGGRAFLVGAPGTPSASPSPWSHRATAPSPMRLPCRMVSAPAHPTHTPALQAQPRTFAASPNPLRPVIATAVEGMVKPKEMQQPRRESTRERASAVVAMPCPRPVSPSGLAYPLLRQRPRAASPPVHGRILAQQLQVEGGGSSPRPARMPPRASVVPMVGAVPNTPCATARGSSSDLGRTSNMVPPPLQAQRRVGLSDKVHSSTPRLTQMSTSRQELLQVHASEMMQAEHHDLVPKQYQAEAAKMSPRHAPLRRELMGVPTPLRSCCGRLPSENSSAPLVASLPQKDFIPEPTVATSVTSCSTADSRAGAGIGSCTLAPPVANPAKAEPAEYGIWTEWPPEDKEEACTATATPNQEQAKTSAMGERSRSLSGGQRTAPAAATAASSGRSASRTKPNLQWRQLSPSDDEAATSVPRRLRRSSLPSANPQALLNGDRKRSSSQGRRARHSLPMTSPRRRRASSEVQHLVSHDSEGRNDAMTVMGGSSVSWCSAEAARLGVSPRARRKSAATSPTSDWGVMKRQPSPGGSRSPRRSRTLSPGGPLEDGLHVSGCRVHEISSTWRRSLCGEKQSEDRVTDAFSPKQYYSPRDNIRAPCPLPLEDGLYIDGCRVHEISREWRRSLCGHKWADDKVIGNFVVERVPCPSPAWLQPREEMGHNCEQFGPSHLVLDEWRSSLCEAGKEEDMRSDAFSPRHKLSPRSSIRLPCPRRLCPAEDNEPSSLTPCPQSAGDFNNRADRSATPQQDRQAAAVPASVEDLRRASSMTGVVATAMAAPEAAAPPWTLRSKLETLEVAALSAPEKKTIDAPLPLQPPVAVAHVSASEPVATVLPAAWNSTSPRKAKAPLQAGAANSGTSLGGLCSTRLPLRMSLVQSPQAMPRQNSGRSNVSAATTASSWRSNDVGLDRQVLVWAGKSSSSFTSASCVSSVAGTPRWDGRLLQ